MSNVEPGWYQAQGDPPGTQRYWDGTQWIGEPQPIGAAPAAANPADQSNFGAPAGVGAPAGYGAQAYAGTDVPRPTEESPVGWFRLWLSRWSDFQGRSRRAEYWWSYLAFFVIYIGLLVLSAILGGILGDFGAVVGSILVFVFAIAMFVPSLSGSVRRLHDTGKSGWFLLLSLIPFIGAIVLLVFFFQDSERGSNQYGASPKYS